MYLIYITTLYSITKSMQYVIYEVMQELEREKHKVMQALRTKRC